MAEEITVDISPAGNVKIEATGFTGNGCAKATEQIELVLGGASRKRKEKPEFHMPSSTNQNITKQTF